MRRTRISILITLCACTASSTGPVTGGGGGGGGPGGGGAAAAARESALTAEEATEQMQDLVGDLGGFVGEGFGGLGGGGLGGGGGGGFQDWLGGGQLPIFQAPDGCTAEVSLLGGEVSLASDCTLASGRHVEGSLHVGFGAECSAFGLAVDFDLLTESAPGAGDEVMVSGSVELSFGDARLYLAVRFDQEMHLEAVHATEVAACVVVDLPTRVLAIDGSVQHSVDGQERHGLRIEDLQASLCEHPPYTGSVRIHGPTHNAELTFDRPTPDESLITVTTDGDASELDLPVLRLPGPFCADLPPVPLVIDYASCGGCGHPDPGGDDDDFGGPGDDDGPGAGGDPGDDPGGGGLPGGGDDPDGQDPLPGGDPDDALD